MLDNHALAVSGPSDTAEPSAVPAGTKILQGRLRPRQLAEASGCAGSWLWHGYLGPGKMTLLTSQWKSGKTTLVSLLLARMAGGGALAGLPVAAGRAAVISEESPQLWDA